MRSFFIQLSLFILTISSGYSQLDNPFRSIGKEGEIITLSKGKFQEVHPYDSLQKIGSVIVNMNTGMIYKIVESDTLYSESNLDPTVISRWYSPDPLASKFPSLSPYNFVQNSPLIMIDPDGRSGIVIIDKETKQVMVHAHIEFYGEGGSADFAKSTAVQMQSNWNSANGVVTIDDIEYKVQFIITASYNPDLTAETVQNNKDESINYVLLDKNSKKDAGVDATTDGNTGNTGTWNPEAIVKSKTTGSHELGHFLGLKHHKTGNFIGKGNPGIMALAGNAVDALFTWSGLKDSELKTNEKGQQTFDNTLNIEKRVVTQQDINDLGIDKIVFDSNGRGKLGGLSNLFHKKTEDAK